ncbi:MAG: hypothetical protein KDB00_07575, partial [Planctomycetales bacterium]|nr:hypothetical protein [Planctomycetales bacterium]
MSDLSKAIRRKAASAGKPRIGAVWLIYLREMQDQLRDRRTLFTIAVLPIMLYPLVGMLLLQIAQFTRQNPTSVCIVGTENIEGAPPLFDGESFAPSLIDQPDALELLSYRWDELSEDGGVHEKVTQWVS